VEEIQRFEADPIHSAGLFEGDIDNVSMDDLNTIRSGELGKVGKGKLTNQSREQITPTNENLALGAKGPLWMTSTPFARQGIEGKLTNQSRD
jgi:hypothetical protein